MTTPGLRVDQIGSAIIAAPGDTVLVINGSPTAQRDYSTGSYADIDAALEVTFNVVVAGTYDIFFNHQIFTAGAGCEGRVKLIIDESDYGGFPEQELTDDVGKRTYIICYPAYAKSGGMHYMGRVNLAVGEHKIKPQWKFEAGAAGLRADTATAFVAYAMLSSGSGAGGTLVDSKQKTADQGSLSASSWNTISELSHSITVTEQEEFLISYRILFKSTSNCTVGIAYRVNSGSWIPLDGETTTTNAWKGLTGSIVINLPVGDKTIEFAVYHDAGTGTVFGNTAYGTLTWASRSSVVQYRGGLVPFQEEGTDILAKPQAINFTGGATVTDNNGVADIEIPGWRTTLDLDFTAEGNQTLSSDTTYSIGGLTWTKINSVNDAVAMAVVNGTGLVIQPTIAGDHYVSIRTLPAITCPITSLVPDIDMGTRFRVTVYISAGNWTAQYDCTELSLENPTTNTWLSIRKIYHTDAVKVDAIHLYNNSAVGETLNSNINSSDVFQMDVVSGIASMDVIWSHGLYSAGWPTQSALIPYAMREATGATLYDLYSGANPILGAVSTWNLLLGAIRAGSGTSFSTTIARIKVEATR